MKTNCKKFNLVFLLCNFVDVQAKNICNNNTAIYNSTNEVTTIISNVRTCTWSLDRVEQCDVIIDKSKEGRCISCST